MLRAESAPAFDDGPDIKGPADAVKACRQRTARGRIADASKNNKRNG
jgi:hypothetical protein